MTHAISVPTPFTDIAELAESFAPRVDEARIMLPNAQPIPEGEWVQFTVGFADGSVGLNGVGRCTAVIDNGEAVAPEHRFDVVLDSLELDEMGQVYFERILTVRAQLAGDPEPETAEVQASDEAGYAEAPLEVDSAAVQEADPYPAAEPEALGAGFEGEVYDGGGEGTETYDAAGFEVPSEASFAGGAEEAGFEQPLEEAAFESFSAEESGGATEVWDAEALEPLSAMDVAEVGAEDVAEVADSADEASAAGAPARSDERLSPPVQAIYVLPPPAAPGELPSPHANGQTLTRGAAEATWTPTPMLRPDPSPSSGLFQYGDGGLPQPERPPRPEIDPSLRVQRALRPSDPLSVPMMHGGAGAIAAADEALHAPEAEPLEDEPLEAEPLEAEPFEAEPLEAAPLEAEPLEAAPLEAESFEAQPFEAEPLEAEPFEVDPLDAEEVVSAEAIEPPAFEGQYEAQPLEEAGEGETRQVDISALDGEYGDDAFEIPAIDDER